MPIYKLLPQTQNHCVLSFNSYHTGIQTVEWIHIQFRQLNEFVSGEGMAWNYQVPPAATTLSVKLVHNMYGWKHKLRVLLTYLRWRNGQRAPKLLVGSIKAIWDNMWLHMCMPWCTTSQLCYQSLGTSKSFPVGVSCFHIVLIMYECSTIPHTARGGKEQQSFYSSNTHDPCLEVLHAQTAPLSERRKRSKARMSIRI